MKRYNILLLVGGIMGLVGIGLCLFPMIHGAYLNHRANEKIQSFYQCQEFESRIDAEIPLATEIPYAELLEAAQAYNERLFRDAQSGLSSQGAYEAPGFDLSSYQLETDVFGILQIDAIELELPLYLGSSQENLSAGATVMGQTSLPIGSANTNCVIAGHRGWKGADYFRKLPSLCIGDIVSVTNLWETLEYEVVESRRILSSDIQSILIRPGEDLLSLFTCEYGSDGVKYRHLIVCRRMGYQ